MSRLYQTGFEWQSATAGIEFDSIFTSPSINTTTRHGGAASLEISGSIAAQTIEGGGHS